MLFPIAVPFILVQPLARARKRSLSSASDSAAPFDLQIAAEQFNNDNAAPYNRNSKYSIHAVFYRWIQCSNSFVLSVE